MSGSVTSCASAPIQLGWSQGFSAHFALGHVLGRGSFATVHEAVSKLTGEAYAVKVLHKHAGGGSSSSSGSSDGCACSWGSDDDEQARQLQLRQLDCIRLEASAWMQAQASKYVAQIEGLYEDDECAYIVQELCAGGTLKGALETHGSLPECEAAAVMRGVLDMLVECHSHNLCYGDCKPANFMLATPPAPAPAPAPASAHPGGLRHSARPGGDAAFLTPRGLPVVAAIDDVSDEDAASAAAGEAAARADAGPRFAGIVRAVDFGCSRPYSRGQPLRQQCGTPLYMAPEMAQQRFDVKIDVWACGVMLYQMLVGRLPFWQNKSLEQVAALRPYEVLAAVRCNEVQYPRAVWCDITPEAQQLVAAMLDRNPASRISAADALAHPWFRRVLGYTPAPSAGSGAAPAAPAPAPASGSANNVVSFGRACSAELSAAIEPQVALGSAAC